MRPRTIVVTLGVLIFGFGVYGLLYPERMMTVANFAPLKPSQPAGALGEIRAVYGGQLIVMGAWAMFAGFRPQRHRGSILLIGLLWLGVSAGRLFGIYQDGAPSLPIWGYAAMELVFGAALVGAALAARESGVEAVQGGSESSDKPPVLE
jgi:hypothetical protein